MRGRRRSRGDEAISGATNPDALARTEAIDANGAYTGPVLSIDDVHKQGVPHKAMWLHVLSSDSQLLLHRRPSAASTCIVRSQQVRRETDEHCASRAIRDELGGLPRHAVASLQPLRPKPRWFLYDMRHTEHHDGVRHERALVSEWAVRLSLNASDAAALMRAHRASVARSAHLFQAAARSGHPPEPIEPAFLPLDQLLSELRMRPGGFCAAGLLPAALIDSIGDLCLQLGTRGAPPGCAADHGWRWFHRLRGASLATLSDTYDPVNVAFDPALQRGLDTSNLLVAALVLGCAWLGFQQLRRAMQRGVHT